jgi:hypothetical protein
VGARHDPSIDNDASDKHREKIMGGERRRKKMLKQMQANLLHPWFWPLLSLHIT